MCLCNVAHAQLLEIRGMYFYCNGDSASLYTRDLGVWQCSHTDSILRWNLNGNPIPGSNKNHLKTSTAGIYTIDYIQLSNSCNLKDTFYTTSPFEVYGELDGEITTVGDTILCPGDTFIVKVTKRASSHLHQSYINHEKYVNGYTQKLFSTDKDTTVLFYFDTTFSSFISYGHYFSWEVGGGFAPCKKLYVNTTLTVCSGIENITDNVGIQIYPNPATDLLHITCTEPIFRARVYNMLGELVHEKTGEVNTLSVDVLAQGVYTISLKTLTGKTAVSRFVKQ